MKEQDNRENNNKKNKKSAMEAAYSYLASRMRTTEEVRKHLRDKGYPGSEITEAVNELIGMRYLDDHLYALRYYEYNREKKRGVLRAERELLEKGIDKETAGNAKEDFLFEQHVDEFEDALAVARREVYPAPDMPGSEPQARDLDDRLAARIVRKLENKGFSRGDIFRVLDTLRREGRDTEYD